MTMGAVAMGFVTMEAVTMGFVTMGVYGHGWALTMGRLTSLTSVPIIPVLTSLVN